MKYLGLLISGVVLTVGSLILGISLFVYESEATPDTAVMKVTPLETLILAIPLIVVFLLGVFLLVHRNKKIKKEAQTPHMAAS